MTQDTQSEREISFHRNMQFHFTFLTTKIKQHEDETNMENKNVNGRERETVEKSLLLTRNVVSSVDEMPTVDGNGMLGRIRCMSVIRLSHENEKNIHIELYNYN